ncbi:MAG: tetratricopeptide repeat protein [Spirochaetota bacterium]
MSCRAAAGGMLLAAVLGAGSCGLHEERAAVSGARRVLGREKKSTEELEKVRGRLRRVVELKVEAASLMREVNRLLGRKYLEMESYNLAEEALLEAEHLAPASPYIKKDLGECYYYLATAAMEEDRRERCLELSLGYFHKAVELKPDYVEARYGLGLVLFFGYQDVGGAVDQMKRVVDAEPDNVDARFALGRFFYEQGELGKALNEYLEITRILPRSSSRRARVEENILQINRELGTEE